MIKYDHLIGIPFEHGKNDCYEIIRRFYTDNYSITLTNYARPDNWWDTDLDLYSDNYKREGFETLDIALSDVRIGDCFLMAVMTRQACHAGIYVGDNLMLHHFLNRRSKVDSYKGIWRNATVAIVRHKDVPYVPKVYDTVDVMDLLPAHRRERYHA